MNGISHQSMLFESIPYLLPTGRVLRPVGHLVLVVAIAAISLSQNLSYYGGQISVIGNGIYLLSFLSTVSYLAVAYLHIYRLVPHLLAKRKYTAYFLWSSVSVAFLGLVRFINQAIVGYLWNIHASGQTSPIVVLDWLSDFALNMLCFTGVSLSVLLKYWVREEAKIAELETRRLRTELESVKSSIDPDMLLGTIPACGRQAGTDPERSTSMILKLSDLLRYQLYETSKDKLFLLSEIRFIENYLELERLRNGKPDFSIETTGNLMVYIPPLVFLPVIKLALSGMKDGQTINITFNSHDDGLLFQCNCLESATDEELSVAMRTLLMTCGPNVESYPAKDGYLKIILSYE